jgi:hypothetical protein
MLEAQAILASAAVGLDDRRPELVDMMVARMGVRHHRRIRQFHLDLLFMGTILTAVGTAVNDIPTWVGALLVLGALVQPAMFVPLAFNAAIERAPAYRIANALVFVATSAAWIALAAIVIGR